MPGSCYYYVWLFLFDIFTRETLGVTVQTGLYSRVELTGENLDHHTNLESVEWTNPKKSCLCLRFVKKSSNTTNYSPCCGKAHFYLNNNTLILENVTAQDEGVFMETIVNESGVTKTLNITLYIVYPPNAREIVVTWTTNTSVSLTCEVTATFTHIMWKREDSPILEDNRHSLSENNQTLNISNMTRSDDGKYSCVATNAYGKSETHTKVTCEKCCMHRENPTSNFELIRFCLQ
nr:contactin-3-like isoform X2 [Misgurnus anguillicaudatus]